MSGLDLLPSIARRTVASDLLGTDAPDPEAFPADLQEPGAGFVTLTLHGHLRGCIGSLVAHQALGMDVMDNARRAAFSDPRFPPVTESELTSVHFEVSVLSAPEPFPVKGEDDLLSKLRPGVDGLILEEGRHRATFLPAVWEDVPDPAAFLMHLKRKAGLPAGYWSDALRFQRYTAHKVSE